MITYTRRRKYKYNLSEVATFDVGIIPKTEIVTRFLTLSLDGILTIKAEYAWDGASGPAFDTKNFMQGSLAHDALYQLMRMGLLDRAYRKQADLVLKAICRADGMSWIRAAWIYRAVRIWSGKSAQSDILTAP